MERRQFLFAMGASAFAMPLLGASPTEAEDEALERALVLSGGGARGAYEAGVIGALAATAGLRDGAPLQPYEVVCGASIGTLNGWFVATGQYSMLQQLWYTIARQNLISVKSQYAALHNPQSGVLDRAMAAFHLMGLVKNQTALLNSGPVLDWIKREMDPETPLIMPLVFSVTNLSLQRPEYFYVRPQNTEGDIPKRVTRALRLTLGPHTIVREATPELLHRALFASAALPLAFDPITIPNPDGEENEYCDGGVASNSPVGIAHAVAKGADVVLLDPPFEPDTHYDDAVEVVFAVYGTMQRKILETEMRNAYFQSVGKRTFAELGPKATALAERENPALANMLEAAPVTTIRYVRPEKVLPVGVVGFDDEPSIYAAYKTGWEDTARGFTPYDWRTFEL